MYTLGVHLSNKPDSKRALVRIFSYQNTLGNKLKNSPLIISILEIVPSCGLCTYLAFYIFSGHILVNKHGNLYKYFSRADRREPHPRRLTIW